MEQVRQDLYLEEQEEKARLADIAQDEKKKQQREELQRQHSEQMYYKELRRQAELEEEEEFKRQMLAKFAEDDRIEQMNAQKRRIKQQEHKRAVEKLLEDRRAHYAMDRVSPIFVQILQMCIFNWKFRYKMNHCKVAQTSL